MKYLRFFLLLVVYLSPNITHAQNQQSDTSIYNIFSSGGSCLVPLDALLQWGAQNIGRSCGQFITPTKDMNEIVAKARKSNCYDVAVFEEKLGIPNHLWEGKIMVRIDIPKDSLKALNLRWPTRTDCGVNADWIPGGKTSGGVWEGFVNQLHMGYFTLKKDLVPCN